MFETFMKMSRLKSNLLTFHRTFGCYFWRGFQSNNVYFCDKKQIIFKVVNEDKNSILNRESSKEIDENLTFEDDEKILKTVMLEKEKDANVRSRLSKECNKLLDKRLGLSSTGFNIRLDQNSTTNTCWENYKFDNLKKNASINEVEAKITCESVSGSNKSTNGVNTPPNRIVRGEPGKVLFAFIPDEWFRFFIPKTGVTGFGTFLFSFGTFLVSKEYYVLEHNFYNGLGMFCVFWGAIKYGSAPVAKFLDREIDSYEKSWQKGRNDTKKTLEEQIEHEKFLQWQAEGELMLIDAKKENVNLQLEEEFRLRQMIVYKEVSRRLNYHVAVGEVYRKIFHRNLVEFVTKEVRKSVTPDLEHRLIDISIENLLAELDEGKK